MIGMDLGTTNSACSVWIDGRIQMIPNRLGELLTPSVVHISADDTVSVGKVAREKAVIEPDSTASVFKRYMGTDRKIVVNGRKYSAPELSAYVLRSLKEDAEVFLGEPVSEIVLSVPAYFNDAQRKASVLAADMAGLHVKRLINEPTAAAIAYGLHEKPEHTYFMVLDLGGGTFDVSIMEYFDGVLEVHASAGDNFLGGEDFTECLVQHYVESLGLNKQQLSQADLARVYAEMEQIKFSFNANDKLTIKPILANQSQPLDMSYTAFQSVVEPLMQRIREPIVTALSDADLSPSDLNEVVLVGGATRMKLFRKAVVQLFKKLPLANVNPDEVVAIGAGIQAGLILKEAALDDVVLTDVAPYSLGIGMLNENDKTGTIGSVFDPIIERNTAIPVSREQTYYSVSDNQRSIEIVVFQGESRLVQNNIKLGSMDVRIPRNKAGEEMVTVRFSYDMSGLLEVDVLVVSTGEKRNIVIQNSQQSLSEEQIRQSRERLSTLKFHPRDDEINRELIARAERLYEGKLSEDRVVIREYLSQFEAVLESQKEADIVAARRELEDLLTQFERDPFGW